MNKRFEDYYVGLDIGTDSIGWAVTDVDYNLFKARGQDLWGSYLFDEAQTKVDRRGFRTARRRIARTHHRLMLLQDLFKEEIAKVDNTFFIRMNNSPLYVDDKDEVVKTKNILFDDDYFDDSAFFKKYPTIFHLRKALIEGTTNDLRVLYLAVHHIIKNRGHFLFENQDFKANDKKVVLECFSKINTFLDDNSQGDEGREVSTLSLERIDDVLDVLKEKSLLRQIKKRGLKIYFVSKKTNSLRLS